MDVLAKPSHWLAVMVLIGACYGALYPTHFRLFVADLRQMCRATRGLYWLRPLAAARDTSPPGNGTALAHLCLGYSCVSVAKFGLQPLDARPWQVR